MLMNNYFIFLQRQPTCTSRNVIVHVTEVVAIPPNSPDLNPYLWTHSQTCRPNFFIKQQTTRSWSFYFYNVRYIYVWTVLVLNSVSTPNSS